MKNDQKSEGGKIIIFEIFTTALFGGLAITGFTKSKGLATNESGKIQRIISLAGLNVRDGKNTLTTRLVKKKQYEWGWEYKYSIPDGRSFKQYQEKFDVLQDGLNNRRRRLKLKDLKELTFDKTIFQQLQHLYKSKLAEQKEIELLYDGLLIIRVYDEPMPKRVEFIKGDEWKVPIGLTRDKNTFRYHDFERIPHLVMGGATTYGKSNMINVIINSLLQTEPDSTKLYLIDLKGGVELSDYERIQQTVSIAYEPEEALETLEMAFDRMKEIQRQLRGIGKKKVYDAGIKERHFVIIDEVGELNPNEAIDKEEKLLKQQCQRYMSQIARMGASLGFRLIVATQYPTGDVIPRQVKQNSDAKLCFRVQSAVASRVVLDEEGAEKLPQIVGRAIYQTAAGREVLQTPLIKWETIKENIAPYLKEVEEDGIIEESESSSIERTGRTDIVTFTKV